MSSTPVGEGYFTGADYTAHYFRDLNPLRVEFTLLVEGLDTPAPGPCCELGFGQGVSMAVHAAGDTSRTWWGCDLMASHAHHAQQLVGAAGVDAKAANQSFADFCARDDLPQFAFIGLHGVWSWVSAANRALIADFLRRQLRPGGAVYISYNALAGWTPLLPLRSLMVDHDGSLGAAALPAVERMRAAAAFAERLLAIDSPLVRGIPGLRATFGNEVAKAPEYLLHEYLGGDWHHSSLAQLAAQLEPAQLVWATGTELLHRLPNIYLTPQQQQFLASVPAPLLRESARDIFVGQGLRRDLFVRGPRRLTVAEQRERLDVVHLVLAQHPSQVADKIAGPVAEAQLPPRALHSIVQALSAAEGAITVGEVCRRVQADNIEAAETLALLTTLVGSGTVDVAVSPAQTARSRPATDRLNTHLLCRATVRSDLETLASPVTGGGVAATVMQQKLLAASLNDPNHPATWAALLSQALQGSGQKLQHDGKVLTTAAEMRPLLQPAVDRFVQLELPVFKRLQVV